ncbi:putative Major facilitator superfamily (MFS) profile domain-containing protein [Seiridium cardinale]|uniref:Major facilitator superfamily (MFS) profile domain-containing protein n=1 Tax=Seiridium cardinale TaxID=138064 RepID=A0ABR2XRN4_9PEZI
MTETASLLFLKWTSLYEQERPFQIFTDLLPSALDKRKTNLSWDERTIQVEDFRPQAQNFSLDSHGFTTRLLPGFTNISGKDEVNDAYIPAVKKMIKEQVADVGTIFVFDWRIRCSRNETVTERINFSDQSQPLLPSNYAHIDTGPVSVIQRIQNSFPEYAVKILQKRVRAINVWKPLSGSVGEWPLAVCDGTTVEANDLVETDSIRQGSFSTNYYAKYNDRQKWYFLKNQTPDEALIFKHFDSEPDVQAPWLTGKKPQETVPDYTSATSGQHVSNSPKSWPRGEKWAATLILSAFAFLQPLSETMLAPAKQRISNDLDITKDFEWLLVNSLILIGVGLSPLFLAPLSEVYGRKPVLVIGSIVFVIWNTGCGAATTLGQLLAFRLLSGFGASVADALAGGLMSDLWAAEERGRAFAIFMAAPLLGPALGPICGAFISVGIGWRWIFWITSTASAIVIVAAILFMHETYEPRIEQLRRRSLEVKTRIPDGGFTITQRTGSFVELMQKNLQRPFRMLGTQVIVQLLACYMALLYGTMFLFLFLYPLMWTRQYSESTGVGSLNYISFAIGLIAGVNIAGHLNDYVYHRLKAHNNGTGHPEFRVPTMVIGTAFVPIGLLWWGWSGEARLHWIMPNIGSMIFATGVYVCSGCVSVYTIDSYSQYAASAVSTNLVMRSLTAAFFPLFAPWMFDALGFGIGATVLAAAFALCGAIVVLVLWFYGARLRARSPYCAAASDDS